MEKKKPETDHLIQSFFDTVEGYFSRDLFKAEADDVPRFEILHVKYMLAHIHSLEKIQRLIETLIDEGG